MKKTIGFKASDDIQGILEKSYEAFSLIGIRKKQVVIEILINQGFKSLLIDGAYSKLLEISTQKQPDPIAQIKQKAKQDGLI